MAATPLTTAKKQVCNTLGKMFIFQSSPNVCLVPKHVKLGIFILGLATLKLFAPDTCPAVPEELGGPVFLVWDPHPPTIKNKGSISTTFLLR